ncbi:MAG: hypothetical protein JW963_18600 [Anaerolineales bacterium]|nr:hypothetical protein [Anaerolineales bacterium]
MELPERIISELELRRNTGERSTRKWVAYDGIVDDVTDYPNPDKPEELHHKDTENTKVFFVTTKDFFVNFVPLW